jgi:Mn2+/Fe2+ NRAMP family transporter
MVIAGVLTATGTGVGIVAAIPMLIGGIPWLTVGALVLPGALLVLLAAKKTKPADEISLSVALAYKLLDRIKN